MSQGTGMGATQDGAMGRSCRTFSYFFFFFNEKINWDA